MPDLNLGRCCECRRGVRPRAVATTPCSGSSWPKSAKWPRHRSGWRRGRSASSSRAAWCSPRSSRLGCARRVDAWTSGLVLGAVLWIGFPLVLWTGPIVHERTPVKLAVIHAGDWLVKLLVIGLIVSTWQWPHPPLVSGRVHGSSHAPAHDVVGGVVKSHIGPWARASRSSSVASGTPNASARATYQASNAQRHGATRARGARGSGGSSSTEPVNRFRSCDSREYVLRCSAAWPARSAHAAHTPGAIARPQQREKPRLVVCFGAERSRIVRAAIHAFVPGLDGRATTAAVSAQRPRAGVTRCSDHLMARTGVPSSS